MPPSKRLVLEAPGDKDGFMRAWKDLDGVKKTSPGKSADFSIEARERNQTCMLSNNRVSPDLETPSNSEDFEQTMFYKGIYAVILPMKVIGLYPTIPTCTSKRRLKLFLNFAYCIFIILLTGLYFIRSLLIFKSDEEFGDLLFFKLQQSVWYFECFVKTVVTCLAWHNKSRLPEFFKKWVNVFGDVPPRKRVKRFAWMAFVISVSFVVLNACGCFYMLFQTVNLEETMLTAAEPFVATGNNLIVLKCMVALMLTIESATAMFPIAFLVVLLYSLREEFKNIAGIIEESVGKSDFSSKIETLRDSHQRLSKLVDMIDQSFHVIVACAYLANIPNLCIILYSILYFRQHLYLVFLNVFWLTFILLHVSTISIFGASLNSAAHSPLSDIYSVKAETLSSQKQFELNLFLSKLNGGSVGVSAMRMFIVNRPTILTVIGLLLTYFALLVQFKNSTVATCICNPSEVVSTSNGTLIP